MDDLVGAMAVSSSLYGEMYVVYPIAMKVKNTTIYFVWYDEDEDTYAISTFTNKDGISSMPVDDDFNSLSDAKQELSRK